MTDQNTAASTSTANAGEKWVNRFGVLKNVSKGTTRGGKPMVRFTLVGKNKEQKEFDVSCVAYGAKVMDAVLSAGNGATISLRGPVEVYDKPMNGGKFTERTTVFKAAMINEPKAKAAGSASTEGASDETAATTIREVADEEIPF